MTDSSLLAAMLAASGSAETTLAVAHAATAITTVDASRRTLTVPAGNGAGFRPNDSLLLTSGAASATAIVERVVADAAGDTIRLTAPIQGTDDFSGGDARIANLLPGQRQLRLVAAVPLAASIPAGSQVSISRGATTEVHVVASAGGDLITLEGDLANTFPMDDPNDLPRVASLEFDLTVGPETYLQLSMDDRHPRLLAAHRRRVGTHRGRRTR